MVSREDATALYEVGHTGVYLSKEEALRAAVLNASGNMVQRLGVDIFRWHIDYAGNMEGESYDVLHEALKEEAQEFVENHCTLLDFYWDSSSHKAYALVALFAHDLKDWVRSIDSEVYSLTISPSQGRPVWLERWPTQDPNFYYATGYAGRHLDDLAGHEAADREARAQLASRICTEVVSVIVDQGGEKTDVYTETLTHATLSGAAIIARWKDPHSGSFYSLARISRERVQEAVQRE